MSHDPVIYQRGDIVHYRDNVGDMIVARVHTKLVDTTKRTLMDVIPTHYAAEPHAGPFGLPQRNIEKARRVRTTIAIHIVERREQ